MVVGRSTVKVADVADGLLPLLVCKAPAASVLMKLPAFAAVTFTVTVQEPVAGIDPPVKVTVEPTAVTVPPQVVLALPATITPIGKVSVTDAELAAVASGLLKVIVSSDVAPAPMVAGLNALASEGAIGVTGVTVQAVMPTVFESSVTAPVRASARPDNVALVLRAMLVSARIFPMNVVPVLSVAELPTCQKMLHSWPPLMRITRELTSAMSVLGIWKIQTAFGLPSASSVSVPVNPADDAKQ